MRAEVDQIILRIHAVYPLTETLDTVEYSYIDV